MKKIGVHDMTTSGYKLVMNLMDLMQECVNKIKLLNIRMQRRDDEFEGFDEYDGF